MNLLLLRLQGGKPRSHRTLAVCGLGAVTAMGCCRSGEKDWHRTRRALTQTRTLKGAAVYEGMLEAGSSIDVGWILEFIAGGL